MNASAARRGSSPVCHVFIVVRIGMFDLSICTSRYHVQEAGLTHLQTSAHHKPWSHADQVTPLVGYHSRPKSSSHRTVVR